MTFPGSRIAIDKVKAAVHYVERFYLAKLVDYHCHTIYSIPIWGDLKRPGGSYYAFTSAAFHVYSRKPVTVHNYHRLQYNEQPVIVIVGMCSGTNLPKGQLRFSSSWLIRVVERTSYGTVALSRKLFLEGRLLHVLASLNRHTTIVPATIDLDASDWEIKLVTWDGHEQKKHREPSWELAKEGASAFE